MLLLSTDSLTKRHGDRVLFDNLSLGLNDTDRVGLIGVNGSGKSTLLRVVAGREAPDAGSVVLMRNARVSYLPQNPEFNPDHSVLDHLFQTDTPAMRVIRAFEETMQALEQAPTDAALLERLQRLHAEMDRLDAWEAESNARAVLSRLGITEFQARLGELSGGQRKRVALARTLLDPADLLIFDEPTNHVDVETVTWLEEYLTRRPGALLLVTHDRYFLDRVVNQIWELERGRVYTYEGNYEHYLVGREAREQLANVTAVKQHNLLRKEMAWLRRGARARSTKQKAHIQRIEALAQNIEDAPKQRDPLVIALGSRRLGKRAVELMDVTKRWDDFTVLANFSYEIAPGERVGIVGPNGAGKSTFLELLAGEIDPDAGEVIRGETVHIAYYDQESQDLPDDMRVVEYIEQGAPRIRLANGTQVSAATMLEWFLFPPEQQYSLIGKLSGGEKRRLYLLRTLMEQPNVLLLDEPTNDLDIQTLTVLEDFLDQFDGSVVAVSHDRYFLDRVVDTILAWEEEGVWREYPGNYSLYLEMRAREAKPTVIEASTTQNTSSAPAVKRDTTPKQRKLTWKEEREFEAIEAEMARLEERIQEVERAMVAAATEYETLATLQEEREQVATRLDVVMERWLELSEIQEGAK